MSPCIKIDYRLRSPAEPGGLPPLRESNQIAAPNMPIVIGSINICVFALIKIYPFYAYIGYEHQIGLGGLEGDFGRFLRGNFRYKKSQYLLDYLYEKRADLNRTAL